MNKKYVASGLALALLLAAGAPVYRGLSLNSGILEVAGLQQVETQVSQNSLLSGPDIINTQDNAERSIAIEAANAEAAKAAKVRAANIVEVKSSSAKSSGESTSTVKKSTSAESSNNAAKKTTVATASKAKAKTNTSTTKTNTSTAKINTTSAKQPVSRGTTSTTTAKAPTQAPTQASTQAPTQTSSSKASAIITTAKSYIGVPYVWGGTTPTGFDCSGFTQFVLNKHGVSIPRVTADQYSAGTAVSKSNLKVGDLVFFTTYKPGPSHVGFYLGSGKFIHASSSKGVTISDINSSYYSSKYIGARRVL